MLNWTNKIGFPVLTVEETSEGLKLTQNRFLATGDPTVRYTSLVDKAGVDALFRQPEEDQTIWHIPLELKTVKAGKSHIDHSNLLLTRDVTLPIADVKSAIYKLNAETCGVCESLRFPAAGLD